MQQWNHCIGMKSYAEMKNLRETSSQTNWMIDANLSVEYWVLKVDLKILTWKYWIIKCIWLDRSRQTTMWTWVGKTTSYCKITILQIAWRFKLIQYSLNSQYYLIRLDEKSGKAVAYIHIFLPYKNNKSSNMIQ